MARTKASEKKVVDATVKTKRQKKVAVEVPKVVVTEKKARRWRQYTQRRREAIRLQNETHRLFIQYTDGFAVVKSLIAEIEADPLCPRLQEKPHQTSENFKLASIDLLQHIMVDIARMARLFQLHRHTTLTTNTTTSAVKLLVADIKAVGLLSSVVETPYPLSIFPDINTQN